MCVDENHSRDVNSSSRARYVTQLSSKILAWLSVAGGLVSAVALAQTVTIQSPTNNGTTSSPVAVKATVQDSNRVSMTQVYVDGTKRLEVAGAGVSSSLAMPSGIHRITVQAIDSKSTVFKSTVYTTVSGSADPPPTSRGMTTWGRIEESSSWQTCGACGNSGGSGALANYSMTRGITSPSMDGSASKFSISGPAYSNGYWYVGHQAAPSRGMQYLAYQFDLYIPSGYENAPQAIEFECQQRLNGWTYNFAWQAEYPTNVWRVFNYALRKWESTRIGLNRFTPGVWHHIMAEFHTDPIKHVVYHDVLTIDGVRHAANIVHSAKSTGGSANYLTNAFQLDLNGRGTPYHVYVDRMSVSFK
jgi:Bacterial Ig domain